MEAITCAINLEGKRTSLWCVERQGRGGEIIMRCPRRCLLEGRRVREQPAPGSPSLAMSLSEAFSRRVRAAEAPAGGPRGAAIC